MPRSPRGCCGVVTGIWIVLTCRIAVMCIEYDATQHVTYQACDTSVKLRGCRTNSISARRSNVMALATRHNTTCRGLLRRLVADKPSGMPLRSYGHLDHLNMSRWSDVSATRPLQVVSCRCDLNSKRHDTMPRRTRNKPVTSL